MVLPYALSFELFVSAGDGSDDNDDEGATFDWNDLEAGSQEAKETESTVLTEKKK